MICKIVQNASILLVALLSVCIADIRDCRLFEIVHGSVDSLGHQVKSYSCSPGFHLKGPSMQTCINGTWSPRGTPLCVQLMCTNSPVVFNGDFKFSQAGSSFPLVKGSRATIVCNPGYSSDHTYQASFVIECGARGIWTMTDGSSLARCTRKRCPDPPDVPWAVTRWRPFSLQRDEGSKVEYLCSRGYTLLGGGDAFLTCQSGQWEGPVPTCVLKTSCSNPPYVLNGKWNIVQKGKQQNYNSDSAPEYPKFEVGVEIEYTCLPRYKLEGPRILQCTTTQIWSRSPPLCVPKDEHIWYCPNIGQIKNGFCKCMGQDTADLNLCMPFHRGTRIECSCLSGYTLQGVAVLTCTHSTSLNIGVWDWNMPTCYKDFADSNDIDLLPDGQVDDTRKAYSSGDIRDNKNKVSTLVIVVVTACSVLGVLLLVMIIVVFRRKKPRAHLFQQGATPPPYARVHNNSMDEHDRLALMAYADASRIHLPSYEEAMHPAGGTSFPSHICTGAVGTSIVGQGVGRASSPTSSDYRRLSNIHNNMRVSTQHQGLQQNVGGDGNNNINNNNNNNSNRHSTVTMSTINRDGISETFGSMDTVNVSMSDASTSVTVETFDSGTSNRSMASQRATAGSLTSSDDHLANDDAPLLDSSSQREADVVSVSSNPSRTSKDE